MMKPKPKILFILFTIPVLLSCSGKLDPAEYMQWMNNKDNHLIVEEQFNNFIFSAQYKTPEYVTLIDLGPKAGRDAFEKKIQEYKGLEYYTFRIGTSDKTSDILKKGFGQKDSINYEKRLGYFSSGIENDLKLALGKDTFPCAIFLFERTYNMTSFDNFILAFDTKNQKDDCDRVLIFNDRNLGVGKIKLTISENSIHKIPNLSLI